MIEVQSECGFAGQLPTLLVQTCDAGIQGFGANDATVTVVQLPRRDNEVVSGVDATAALVIQRTGVDL